MPASHEPNPLDAWVLVTASRAVAYARSLVQDVHLAEDIVQDCYCRLIRRADVYDLPNDGLKILLRAITNACINARTRRRPWLRLTRNHDDGSPDIDPADPHTAPVDQAMLHGELSEAIAAGLATLPAVQRAAVQLKADGLSQAEIAEILDVTPSHAGVLIHRARKALGVFLAPYLGSEATS